MKTTKAFYIETWGCQMNEHDSEKITGLLLDEGYGQVYDETEADIILLNTCSVREKATEKVFSKIGRLKRLKRKKRDLLIGVCGCVAQEVGEMLFERAPSVDLVVGTRSYPSLPGLLQRSGRGEKVIDIDLKGREVDIGAHLIHRNSTVQAKVTIMEGCDHICSFCIVPHTRGREASRPFKSIVEEARRLRKGGYREIELLGQNVNGYRHDGKDFCDLLATLADIEGIDRIRFITSHPQEFTPRMVETIRDHPSICRYLHLPAQSGSDRILRAMRRGYTRRDYLGLIEIIRCELPEAGVSGDLIVGYPGETDDDFKETLSLVEEVRYDNLFCFKYSPRPYTSAAYLGNPVSEEVKQRRLEQLLDVHREIKKERYERFVGKTVEVLADRLSLRGESQLTGRTDCNKVVNFAGPSDLIRRFCSVRVEQALANSLCGSLVGAESNGAIASYS